MSFGVWLVYDSPGLPPLISRAISMLRQFLFCAAFLCAPFISHANEVAKIEFNRDIRPILSDSCYLCHGPDKNARKAKMRLDVREDALAKKAFEPGKPDESELVKRIFSKDAD